MFIRFHSAGELMSFDVTVILPKDEALFVQLPSDESKYDQWLNECESRTLFDAPLGDDLSVAQYWSGIAKLAGLPLIEAIYNTGLRVEANRLAELERELDALETEWRTLSTTMWQTSEARGTELLEQLLERMAYFRKAVAIAKANAGLILVS
jgi:hypothetical protein